VLGQGLIERDDLGGHSESIQGIRVSILTFAVAMRMCPLL
jgi:hypothetical protein